MQTSDFPILEFDPDPSALIEPAAVCRPAGLPPACVLAILHGAITRAAEDGRAQVITRLGTGLGPHPVYRLSAEAGEVTLCNPGVGSAFAAVRLEELIAMGCQAFVACGACGVLDPELSRGRLILPRAAVRDEGASYHYLPPCREVEADPRALACLMEVLRARGVDYVVGTTWTTDGVYRETRGRIARRRLEGCLTVEMETAALFAVARSRGVPLAQILWAGDDVSGEQWDPRDIGMRPPTGDDLLELAAAAALALLGPPLEAA